MARRDDGLLKTLFELGARLPWWLSVLLATSAYLVLGHVAAQPAPDIALSGFVSGAGLRPLCTARDCFSIVWLVWLWWLCPKAIRCCPC